jgi:hypothetical protein
MGNQGDGPPFRSWTLMGADSGPELLWEASFFSAMHCLLFAFKLVRDGLLWDGGVVFFFSCSGDLLCFC